MAKDKETKTRKRKRSDAKTPEAESRYPQPSPGDTILDARAIYVHSDQPDYDPGYILTYWFAPSQSQTKALGRAKVAHTGYYVRMADGSLHPAMKCIIEKCPLCEMAIYEGVNPI